jgi:hypothetical protein|nr:MAG TPA: hypothetical protein [Caudoviricetes sp.]
MFKSLRQMIWQALFPDPVEATVPTLLKASEVRQGDDLAKELENLALTLYSSGLDAVHKYRAKRRQAIQDGKPVDDYELGYCDGVWDAVDALKVAACGRVDHAGVPDPQGLVQETSRFVEDLDEEDFELDIPQWVNGDKATETTPGRDSLHPVAVRDELSGLGGDAA